MGSGRAPCVAGGLVWVVGKANGLFDGDLRQVDVQRELALGSPLRADGQCAWPRSSGGALPSSRPGRWKPPT